jgi:prenylcysteine oxidase / farnesylcysteine lyase
MMALKLTLSLLPLLFICLSAADQSQIPLSSESSTASPHRVAIIGAGAGGSSAAYHLRKFINTSSYDLPISINIFDNGPRVGGRTTTVNALDDERFPVELGASIFVKINYILYNATRDFGLKVKTELHQSSSESLYDLGVWDGSEFVFKQSSGNSWWQGYWDVAKLLWKYGVSPIRTQRLTQSTFGRFLRFYDLPTFPFSTLQKAVTQTGLLEFTSAPGDQVLSKAGISDAFARDIVQASTRVNYAQNLDQIHGLETLCCMATDGAMAVEGGNWQIFDEAVKRSKANVTLNTEIGTIMKDEADGKYHLSISTKDQEAAKLAEGYDAVILAAPYQFSKINFVPQLDYLPSSVDYVSLHVTLFTSPHILSATFFGMPADHYKHVPSTILTTLSPDSNSSSIEPHKFYSISTLQVLDLAPEGDIASPQYLYKIFSPAPLTGTLMSQLFGFEDSYANKTVTDPISDIPKEHLTWFYEKKWHSYPYEIPRTLFERIRLDGRPGSGKGIWYTSGIEPFISTMETSALMGMNVAKLIVDELEWREKETDGIEEDLR